MDQANTAQFKVNGLLSLGPATDNEANMNSYFLGSLFKTYPDMPRLYSLFLPNEKELTGEAASLVFGSYDATKYGIFDPNGEQVPLQFLEAGVLPNQFALNLASANFKEVSDSEILQPDDKKNIAKKFIMTSNVSQIYVPKSDYERLRTLIRDKQNL